MRIHQLAKLPIWRVMIGLTLIYLITSSAYLYTLNGQLLGSEYVPYFLGFAFVDFNLGVLFLILDIIKITKTNSIMTLICLVRCFYLPIFLMWIYSQL